MSSIRYESSVNDASPLGQALHFQFSGRTARNRFLKAASTEHLASWDVNDVESRGIPTDKLINVYKVRRRASVLLTVN